ncbi:YkvI family membrane protein [Corticicoccus populi]|uniref:Branched-chain amino acid transport system II carrier protein n=1 Tax=Corticicoccus populi TaxID=1812821 RepID=A0ABW5WZN7_9STAP
MKKTMKVLMTASAFIGVIVGAGFASGQEVLQYFTSFGLPGIFAVLISTVIFAYIGMMLVWLGSKAQTTSYNTVIYKISHFKVVGILVDCVLVFTLFGVGVVMIAGAGANLNQQFGVPHIIGAVLMAVLVMLTGMLKVNKVIAVISSITPFLIIFVIIISIYSFVTMDSSLTDLNETAQSHGPFFPNWFIAGLNYAAFNTSVGAAMSIVMGSAEKDGRTAALGGLVGGLGLGALILLSYFAIFSKIEEVGHLEMPMLGIVNDISPVLGIIMAVVIFGMIFNTAISMFFAFVSRFIPVETKRFNIVLAVTLIVGLLLSGIGFTDLVSHFYGAIGYMGLLLIIVLIITAFRFKKIKFDE